MISATETVISGVNNSLWINAFVPFCPFPLEALIVSQNAFRIVYTLAVHNFHNLQNCKENFNVSRCVSWNVTVYCENIVENLFRKMFTYCFQFMQIINLVFFCFEANVLYIICLLSERILMGKQLYIFSLTEMRDNFVR